MPTTTKWLTGFEKTFQGILANYWFPTMRKRIYDHLENCIVCLVANTSTHAREGELQITSCLIKSFEILHMDYFGPLQLIEDGFCHILVIVDAFT